MEVSKEFINEWLLKSFRAGFEMALELGDSEGLDEIANSFSKELTEMIESNLSAGWKVEMKGPRECRAKK